MARRKGLALTATVMAMLIAGSVYLAASASGGGKLQTVRLGVAPYQDLLSVYIGVKKGWYKQEGIDVKPTIIQLQDTAENLLSGAIAMGSMCDVDVLVKGAKAPELRMTNPSYIFLGSALLVRPNKGWLTYWDYRKRGLSHAAAVKAVGRELKGKTAIATHNSDQELAIILAAQKGGLDPKKDMKFLNFEANDGLAAFLAGHGDVYNGGLPQRTRAVKEGMIVLITAKELRPEGVIHCGFATTKSYLDKHMDVLVKFQRVWYRIQQAILKDPNGIFPIIANVLNSRTGAQVTVADLKNIWNNLELFPPNEAQMAGQILNKTSPFYWRPRYAYASNYYTKAGQIQGHDNIDALFAYPLVHAAYVKVYGNK